MIIEPRWNKECMGNIEVMSVITGRSQIYCTDTRGTSLG